MKKIITTVFCTALALCSGLTVYAAENLDRDDIEAEIWEDMWNGKGDNGLDFPEASYKHHLLDKWLDENYGSEDYDWTEMWQMTDKNGDTVDTFPPFSTLEEDESEAAGGYEINDNGADSPRVVGEVTGGTETASEGGSSAEGNDTTSSPSDVSEGNSDDSGVNPLAIIAGVAALAGVGGAAYYFTRKRK